MKKLLSIIIIGLLLSVNAYSMTQNQMFIIQQTLNVDQGKVTKQMHTDFWKDVPNKDDVVEFMETTGLMAKISRDGMQYQMELWKSALISYQNKQVFKSDDYLKVREVMNDFIYRVSKNIKNLLVFPRTFQQLSKNYKPFHKFPKNIRTLPKHYMVFQNNLNKLPKRTQN